MQRRKADFQTEEPSSDSHRFDNDDTSGTWQPGDAGTPLKDYVKFAFYCLLLAVPLYAITVSILRQDWIMVIIDALFVPVGFVHGVLLLLEYLH